MEKKHTKKNGYRKGTCQWSPTGYAWWKRPKIEDVCRADYCTCIPCKPPRRKPLK